MTRFGSAVLGIALLVFAAIFAFGGLGDTGSSPTERTDPAPTRSVPPITVTAQPPDPEKEATKRAKEQCRDLLPLIEDESQWDPQGRLRNRDYVSSIVASQGATMTIESRADGDLVTIRSDLPTVDKFVRPLVTMTSSSATCTADQGD